jgi:sugar O-acyltransferase (sialic acid O-acetyltransferase NeuD family)
VSPQPILLLGAGGHARACIDVLELEGRFRVAGLVGLDGQLGERLLGYPVLGTEADLAALRGQHAHALVAVGQIESPDQRMRLFQLAESQRYALPVVISPRALVSPHASLGAGTIVMHGAIVNAAARVGSNCILNSQSLIEHDAVIGDHCHISTAAAVNGGARVGTGTFIGSHACLRHGVSVGARCVIGMGQRVFTDCEAGTRLTDREPRS